MALDKVKKRRKREDEEPVEDDVVEAQSSDDDEFDDDDVLTGKDLKRLVRGGGFPKTGEYICTIKSVEETQAKGRMPRMFRVTLGIEDAPFDEPPGGYEDVRIDLYPRFTKAQFDEADTDDARKTMRTRQRIGREQAAEFAYAALRDNIGDDDTFTLSELLKATMGEQVAVVVRESDSGYQRLRWRSVEE